MKRKAITAEFDPGAVAAYPDKRPVTRLWNLLRAEKAGIINIYFFALFGGLVQLSIPVGVQSIIGFVLAGTLSASLVVLITIIVAGVLFTGIMQINQMRVIETIQQRIFLRYAYAFADRIPRFDLKKLDNFYLPELVNRFFDITNLQKSISKLLLDLPVATIQVVFGLILLSLYHSLFIVFGILLLVLLWLILKTTAGTGLSSSLEESRQKYALASWFEEMARLARSFKMTNSTGLHLQKADARTIGYLKARTDHFRVLIIQYRALLFFKTAITLSMLVAGVYLLLNQQINIGQFVAAEIVIILVINAVEKMIVNLDSVYDVLTAMEKLGKLTDKPVETGGTRELDGSKGLGIVVNDLGFSFDGSKQILKNISFSISSGEKVGIKGIDGAGKTTLINLLAGVYREFDGQLIINDAPLNNYRLQSLRENVSVLLPDENIFHGTLWENITMGRKDVDRDYVTELVRVTGLFSFLSVLPSGYDTELDPTGKRLPRNVVRRILLVRTLANKPRLVLMDEPWQGMDTTYQENMARFVLGLKDATVIVATNDEWFLQQCDKQINLKRND